MTQQWDAADAAYIRNVFSQPSGQRFLAIIKTFIPKLKKASQEISLMEAWEKQGAENFYDDILSLIEVQPELEDTVNSVDLTKEGD